MKNHGAFTLLLFLGVMPLLMASDCGPEAFYEPSGDANPLTQPLWTPDGATIVFGVSTVDAYGARLELVFPGSPGDIDYGHYSLNISPVGSRLAFTSTRHKPGFWERVFRGKARNLEIGTSALDGSDYRRLTENETNDTHPVWSPDGSRIAFVSHRVLDDGQYNRHPEIYTMSPDGSDVRIVTPPGVYPTNDPPVWSPDGRRLAFLGIEPGTKEEPTRSVFYTIAANGSNLARVAQTRTLPAWSPDGTRIAFLGSIDGDKTSLHTALPDGSDYREVLQPDWPIVATAIYPPLSWSPDGVEIRLIGYDGRKAGIFAMKADGSDYRFMAEAEVRRDYPIAWSPDGSRIAVLGNVPNSMDSDIVLYTMASNGSDVRVLVRSGPGGALVAEGSAWQDLAASAGACSQGVVVPNPRENQELVQDCATLLEIGNTLAGDGVALGWSAAVPIADWPGVTVGGNPSRVRSLVFSRGLTGVIPWQLARLTALEELTLSGGLTGPIPAQLGDLGNLRRLTLNANDLTGGIPPQLGNLAKLEYLSLIGSEMTGEIPPELGNLTNLTSLSVLGNNLTGEIPPELGNLAKVEYLSLERNNLTGQIPPELGKLEKLRQLTLGYNNFSGCLPNELSDKPRLLILRGGLEDC